MRTENEVIDLVLAVAEKDESVRAVIRTNLLPKREYDYYNFYFVVSDVDRFDADIFDSCFGDRILLYRGDKNYPDMFQGGTKAHLMVYRDGTTIAITVMDKDNFLARYNGEDTHENVWIGDTYLKLLDKDNMLPKIERLDEKQTWFSETPTEEQFSGICNEFWWVLKSFAEYALRKELTSSMFYLNVAVRDLLNRMIRWHIFLEAGEPVDMGILDSNMEKHLEPELFDLYKKTYPSADYESIWEALGAVQKLWSIVGNNVAKRCGFKYPYDIEKDMTEFIQGLRK